MAKERKEECRTVNPPCLQILRIDGEGMIDDIIMHDTCMMSFVKKKRKKDAVGFVTFDLP